MKIVDASITLAFALAAGSVAPMPSVGHEATTTSDYRYTIVDYPGSTSVCLAVNTSLHVICDAQFNQQLPYVYDAASRRITLPAVAPPAGWSATAFGINDSSTVAGYVYPPDDSIENGLQGISIEGVVSGAFIDGAGNPHGFIARPKDE